MPQYRGALGIQYHKYFPAFGLTDTLNTAFTFVCGQLICHITGTAHGKLGLVN